MVVFWQKTDAPGKGLTGSIDDLSVHGEGLLLGMSGK